MTTAAVVAIASGIAIPNSAERNPQDGLTAPREVRDQAAFVWAGLSIQQHAALCGELASEGYGSLKDRLMRSELRLGEQEANMIGVILRSC